MDIRHSTIFPYQRIVVVGVTGCGKSRLAEKLADRLGMDFIELDAFFWKPDWVESGEEELRAKVQAATRAPAWVLAGNYSKLRDIIWPRAEVVVWLDYPYLLCFKRLWERTWRRWWTKELLWGTNYEKLWPQFRIWSKESLFYWQVHSYRKHKRVYSQLLGSPEYSHLQVFHFIHPSETEEWINSL
jgi:adenylate kinase family enzyme